MSTPLRDAISRIRVGREMTTTQMADALGLSPSRLVQIEHGRACSVIMSDAAAEHLARYGYAQDLDGASGIVETPVETPADFAETVDQALGLTDAERATLEAGLAGVCDPPFPTDAERERIVELLRGRASA